MKPGKMNDRRSHVFGMSTPKGSSVALFTDHNVLPVVGESQYQPALRAIVRGRMGEVEATAHLIAEPSNRYDRNAVRVDIEDRTVGYLARETAADYQPLLLRLAEGFRIGTCPASIGAGSLGIYGVWLTIGRADDVEFVLGCPSWARPIIGRTVVAVVNDHLHAGYLERFASQPDGPARSWIAMLGFCTIETGSHKGQSAVEVRMDGHPVGHLSYAMSQRYGVQVSEALADGKTPGCKARVVQTVTGLKVRLLLPRNLDELPT